MAFDKPKIMLILIGAPPTNAWVYVCEARDSAGRQLTREIRVEMQFTVFAGLPLCLLDLGVAYDGALLDKAAENKGIREWIYLPGAIRTLIPLGS